jgi:hypothetical protein
MKGVPSSAAPSTSVETNWPCQCTVGLVVNVYDHLLALFEAEERTGKLPVVGRHRDDPVRGKLDGFHRDRKFVIRLAGARGGDLFWIHRRLLAKATDGREQKTSCHNTRRLQEASAREERTRHCFPLWECAPGVILAEGFPLGPPLGVQRRQAALIEARARRGGLESVPSGTPTEQLSETALPACHG